MFQQQQQILFEFRCIYITGTWQILLSMTFSHRFVLAGHSSNPYSKRISNICATVDTFTFNSMILRRKSNYKNQNIYVHRPVQIDTLFCGNSLLRHGHNLCSLLIFNSHFINEVSSNKCPLTTMNVIAYKCDRNPKMKCSVNINGVSSTTRRTN